MPSLSAHGFGLDDSQLTKLRGRRTALDLERASLAQLIGHAVGNMAREWAALGGLDTTVGLPTSSSPAPPPISPSARTTPTFSWRPSP